MNTTVSYSLNDLAKLAPQLLDKAKNVRVIAFTGNLGAGKTTLIGEILKKLGITDFAGSPTFSLVNEYLSSENDPVYHFDFYRIKNESEILDIGWEDYLNKENAWIFIEWPEKIENLLPDNFLHVNIHQEALKRIFKWKMF